MQTAEVLHQTGGWAEPQWLMAYLLPAARACKLRMPSHRWTWRRGGSVSLLEEAAREAAATVEWTGPDGDDGGASRQPAHARDAACLSLSVGRRCGEPCGFWFTPTKTQADPREDGWAPPDRAS